VVRSNFDQRRDLLNTQSGGALCRPQQFDPAGEAVNDGTVA
jgi:hypothetical protein